MSVRPATESTTRQLTISKVVARFAGASNATFLGTDPQDKPWVYKPTAGVRHLWDFPSETLANREILAYEVSECMSLDLVPETVAADGPFGPGAAQRYRETDPDFDQRQWFEEDTDPQLWPVAVFDLITNNADRKLGHILVDSPTGRLFAIDHGLTFHHQDKLRTVLWGFGGQPIPSRYLQALGRLWEALKGDLGDRAAQLLAPEETQALHRRTKRLLDNPIHPEPPPDRPALPWPIW